MADILDIEKIGELGKLDIKNLKLILRELLADILAEQKQTEDFKIDLSVILKLLFEKGLISKEEYEQLKDKINSLIDSEKVDDAFEDNLTEENKQDIIKNSKFKGFFKTYDELINKIPVSKAQHGDYAYIKDFNADTYNINNIEEYIFDITYGKWMSATDTTHLRNVYIREDEEDTGRLNGEPIDNDLLQYNEALKRWVCKTFEEADVARKSNLDFHIASQIDVEEDIVGFNDGSIKDNGRLIVKLDTANPPYSPMHINKLTLQKILDEIDTDYYTKLETDIEVDEYGVTRVIITGEDNDKYGNAIRRNVTNQVMKSILDNLYGQISSTFDIKIDPVSGRILNINEEEPAKYVPHGINTFNVDKIISAIDKDYNNAFKLSDKEETNYVDILKRVLEGYNELNIDEYNVQSIIERLTKLYENKSLWDRYTKILNHEKNKNITPEVFNDLIDLLHYLYISKDLIRDELLERDIVINGKKTFTDDLKITGENIKITNPLCTMLINAGLINYDNEKGVILTNHQYINISNKDSIIDIESKEVNIKNYNGIVNIEPQTNFNSNVFIKGDLTVEGTTTNINTEDLVVEDNIITLNKGEQGNGVSKAGAGIIIDRGTADDLFIGFDESRDKLVTGLIKDETNLSELNEIAVLEKDLDIKKPLVYNPKNHIVQNSELLRTDIDGATTFIMDIPNNKFKKLDPVYFEGDELTLCSITTYERCEVIGIIGEVTDTYVKVVVTGFLPCDMDLPNGTVIYLLDGAIGAKKESLIIQRKVGIKVPNGMVVDIQKNSGKESTEVKTECIMHRVLEPFVEMVVPDEDFEFEHNTKIFIDGVLQIEDVTYEIDYQKNFLRILEPFEDRVDLLMITAMEWANDGNQYVTNKEVDDMFTHGIEPRPPFEDTEYLQDYEVDRIFGIISSLPDTPDVVKPNEAEWCKDSDVDNIFSARALYSKYNLLEQSITKNIFVEGNFIYYFSDKKYLDELDFVEIDKNGIFNKISFDTKNIVGIIQQITEFDNGLIEYQINTSKIIPYSDIPLYKYSIKYGVEISQGENLYISDKINKFSGNLLCSFSNVAMFIEYEKKNKIVEQDTNKSKKYTLENNKYYIFETNKMSITQLDLFEVDSPNYCKVNLINNTCMNEKNLFYEIQLGKKMFDMYRFDDKYVLKPIKGLNCFTELNIEETTNSNLIKI
jgi:hypothetical protein